MDNNDFMPYILSLLYGLNSESTKNSIGNITSPYVSKSMVAPENLNVGDYVTVGDTLYKVTATTAEGEDLVPDTNVVKTTIVEEIQKIKAQSEIINAHEPGLYMLSEILCPDFAITTGRRKISKKFNKVKQEYINTDNNPRIVFITGSAVSEQSTTPSNVSDIPLTNLIPVNKLRKRNCNLYLETFIKTSYTGPTDGYIEIFFCTVTDDVVSNVSATAIANTSAVNGFSLNSTPITVPAGATHFALALYSAGAGPRFEGVFNFITIPA